MSRRIELRATGDLDPILNEVTCYIKFVSHLVSSHAVVYAVKKERPEHKHSSTHTKCFFLLIRVEISHQKAILPYEQLRGPMLEIRMTDFLHEGDLVSSRGMIGIQHAKIRPVGQRLGINTARPVGTANSAEVTKLIMSQAAKGYGANRQSDLRCQLERIEGELAARNAHHAPQL